MPYHSYCNNYPLQVSISTVLQQEAYLLFYIKDEGYSPPGGKTATPSSPGNLATKSHDQHKTSIQRNGEYTCSRCEHDRTHCSDMEGENWICTNSSYSPSLSL